MCGISGFVKFEGQESAATLRRMTDAIRHRGPDDEGYLLLQEDQFHRFSGPDSIAEIQKSHPPLTPELRTSAGLGFRRLSIQDLSSCGHQPMLSEDGQVALTFNCCNSRHRALKL